MPTRPRRRPRSSRRHTRSRWPSKWRLRQPPPAAPDYMAELEQLGQLKNQGVITEEEFQAKKKLLLGI